MKRMKKMLAALLSAVCLLAAGMLAAPALPVQAAHSLPDSAFAQIPGSDIYTSPSVSQAEAAAAVSNYLLLPENVRQRMMNDGVNIYLIAAQDETILSTKVSNYGDSSIGVAALTTHPTFRKYVYKKTGQLAYVKRVRNGMIEIQTDTPSNVRIDSGRLIHEAGHYIDTAFGAQTGTYFAISDSDAWQQYYAAFGPQILQYSAYAAAPSLYNANECWADAFRLSLTDPDRLIAISPQLYAFVTDLTAAIPAVEPSLR